jgi:hypothetical protein
MGKLSLFAIGVDEFRDFFAAPEPLAGTLRLVAAEHRAQPVAIHKKPSLLAKMGPIMKRPIESPIGYVDPADLASQPTEADVEALLAGQYIPPDRLVPSWREVLVWVKSQAWGSFELVTTEQEIEDTELALVRLGLPAEYALSKLIVHDLQIPLQPFHGLRAGYGLNAHALQTAAALHAVLDDAPPNDRTRVTEVLGFLDQFPTWATQAAQVGRDLPDVVGTFWP